MKPTPVKPTTIIVHPNKKDREQVRVLSGMGAPLDFIASEINLSIEELTLHYTADLENGPKEANARVAQTFFDMATSGEHPTMTIAWMKMRANWVDNAPPPKDTEQEEADALASRERLASLLQNRPDVVEKVSASATSKASK